MYAFFGYAKLPIAAGFLKRLEASQASHPDNVTSKCYIYIMHTSVLYMNIRTIHECQTHVLVFAGLFPCSCQAAKRDSGGAAA